MRQNFSGFCMEEFPQYKAYNNGLGNLTTVELISLVIGTGTSVRDNELYLNAL
ncbi:hypothetical protein [Segatella copri]|uniref:hypothetical protein n=1 Tax=Segatella copri TaxID=165179 RepID=UPI00223130B5|nr:hypothetical protein [Segatella copri]MCW4123353.1 hypothetical protein [Segatella copri]